MLNMYYNPTADPKLEQFVRGYIDGYLTLQELQEEMYHYGYGPMAIDIGIRTALAFRQEREHSEGVDARVGPRPVNGASAKQTDNIIDLVAARHRRNQS